MIEENDVREAYKEYSSWVFTSLVVENGISYHQMEDFLYSLISQNPIISKDQLIKFMAEAKISVDVDKVNYFTDHLVNLSVIAREIKPNLFAFEYDFDESRKNKIMADKLNTSRYKIHPALYPFWKSNRFMTTLNFCAS